ncbi:MerR family transcriptional regulator [Lapidilactobacillus wuchangensis]|uniref:MerR family transcriptional regulator n=1 Tax=Lapidilactobacillus wuchangensis TaxID=2486001 RepID=UPI000F7A4827|nr:MerR family transcriptional regulator [Lapidilactobacillus wuchangensis]
MGLTISDAANDTGIPITTIRYYDKMGLLPFLARDDNSHRHFSRDDIGMLELINCLKCTGMPLAKIRQFIEMYEAGDSTLPARLALVKQQKKDIEARIAQDQAYLAKVDCKIEIYQKAVDEAELTSKK